MKKAPRANEGRRITLSDSCVSAFAMASPFVFVNTETA
jgi:hypothetical protein